MSRFILDCVGEGSTSRWGDLNIGVTWQPLAAAAAAISTLGIVLFSGIWPGAPNRKLSKMHYKCSPSTAQQRSYNYPRIAVVACEFVRPRSVTSHGMLQQA